MKFLPYLAYLLVAFVVQPVYGDVGMNAVVCLAFPVFVFIVLRAILKKTFARDQDIQTLFAVVSIPLTALLCMFMASFEPATLASWENSYWLSDLRTGDMIMDSALDQDTYTTESRVTFGLLSNISLHGFRPVMTVAATRPGCVHLFGKKITPRLFGTLDGFSMRFIGRASKPDYRYLFSVEGNLVSFGCVTEVLVDASTVRLIKQAWKAESKMAIEQGLIEKTSRVKDEAAEKARVQSLPALKAEIGSVTANPRSIDRVQ